MRLIIAVVTISLVALLSCQQTLAGKGKGGKGKMPDELKKLIKCMAPKCPKETQAMAAKMKANPPPSGSLPPPSPEMTAFETCGTKKCPKEMSVAKAKMGT